MRHVQGILCSIMTFVIILLSGQFALAQEPGSKNEGLPTLDLCGVIRNAEGTPIPNGMIIIEQGKSDTKVVRKGVSDKEGRFCIKAVSQGPATITFEAYGYDTLREHGVQLVKGMDLSKILQWRWSWWVLLLLLMPGVVALGLAAGKEYWEKRMKASDKPADSGKEKTQQGKGGQNSGAEKDKAREGCESEQHRENRFLIAACSGLTWMVTLALLGWLVAPGYQGIYLFHPSFVFEFYVPILGFIGALLYVLDLCRRGREDIPRGTEFGMRLIMGPYVAIIMVVLFGNDLNIVNLQSTSAKGALAFFSGLLVVIAIQGLIERGNEWLGKWRRESRYQPSEIAKEFQLDQEEDLKLRKVGIKHLIQIRERGEKDLREEFKKAELDESLVIGFKKKLEEGG
jgi:hypothetical protein